jgi:hypothetical protein
MHPAVRHAACTHPVTLQSYIWLVGRYTTLSDAWPVLVEVVLAVVDTATDRRAHSQATPVVAPAAPSRIRAWGVDAGTAFRARVAMHCRWQARQCSALQPTEPGYALVAPPMEAGWARHIQTVVTVGQDGTQPRRRGWRKWSSASAVGVVRCDGFLLWRLADAPSCGTAYCTAPSGLW